MYVLNGVQRIDPNSKCYKNVGPNVIAYVAARINTSNTIFFVTLSFV